MKKRILAEIYYKLIDFCVKYGIIIVVKFEGEFWIMKTFMTSLYSYELLSSLLLSEEGLFSCENTRMSGCQMT